MKKSLLSPLAAVLVATGPVPPSAAFAQDAAPPSLARTYADIAFHTFSDAADAADVLREAAATLKREPNAISLVFARLSWVEARAPFMQGEILRRAGRPGEPGKPSGAGALDAPVNPDFIEGPATAIINDAPAYPLIDGALLGSLNGKGGEANIATGFHALEFLLWGPDKNPEGAGERAFTDFMADSPVGARRADYVVACAELPAEELAGLAAEWAPDKPGNQREALLKRPSDEVLAWLLEATGTLAASELAGKRLRPLLGENAGVVAEESPFSEIGHVDLLHATAGIANVMAGAYIGTGEKGGMRVKGTGLIAVVEAKDAAQGAALREAVNKAVMAARALKGPFDKIAAAPKDDPGRKAILACAEALEALGKATAEAASALGLTGGRTAE